MPTNEQLKDIAWWDANQPGSLFIWIEDLEKDLIDHSGWGIISTTGYNTNRASWTVNAVESGHIKIHHRPEPAVYMPEVGEECEVSDQLAPAIWLSLTITAFNYKCTEPDEFQVVGIDGNGNYAIYYSNDGLKFRPIKTDAEIFIEKATELHDVTHFTVEQFIEALAKSGQFKYVVDENGK
tara:strand:+ start:842 stop:1384 length:543 start_codon:yes stop_codon:yes gene_type:complete